MNIKKYILLFISQNKYPMAGLEAFTQFDSLLQEIAWGRRSRSIRWLFAVVTANSMDKSLNWFYILGVWLMSVRKLSFLIWKTQYESSNPYNTFKCWNLLYMFFLIHISIVNIPQTFMYPENPSNWCVGIWSPSWLFRPLSIIFIQGSAVLHCIYL